MKRGNQETKRQIDVNHGRIREVNHNSRFLKRSRRPPCPFTFPRTRRRAVRFLNLFTVERTMSPRAFASRLESSVDLVRIYTHALESVLPAYAGR